MSNELIIKGAELALKAIEYAVANKQSESELLQELNLEKYDGLTEDQKLRIVFVVTDGAASDAQAAINQRLEDLAPSAPD
ncbi:hypothetical protein [uncultured Paraglaciecola sp.]|uniref:hypothetical protein n=1 Tax=uncultured Paraglaciecola sp. TaxID=1765024 RepID=UPI00260F9760|nr:hypothetical protein [uncultured Paraglaciecola sp.]